MLPKQRDHHRLGTILFHFTMRYQFIHLGGVANNVLSWLLMNEGMDVRPDLKEVSP